MSNSDKSVTIKSIAVLGAGGTIGKGIARNAVAAEHPDDDLAVLFRGTSGD